MDITRQPAAGWEEAQCTAALAHLEGLQAQIDNLRLAIPRIIEPFHRPPNPTTFKLYAQSVTNSQNGIKDLHAHWKSPEIQTTFEHIKKSFGANTDLSASASIPAHGWADRERSDREANKSKSRESTEEIGAAMSDEDISCNLVEFSETHPSIKLETKDDNLSITTQFVSGSVNLSFRVNVEREANGQYKLHAECLGSTEPFVSITRCIASRPQANDLKRLLDMIAAYKTVKGTSCAKCKRLLNDAMLVPTARRSEHSVGTRETSRTVWQAIHESCLE